MKKYKTTEITKGRNLCREVAQEMAHSEIFLNITPTRKEILQRFKEFNPNSVASAYNFAVNKSQDFVLYRKLYFSNKLNNELYRTIKNQESELRFFTMLCIALILSVTALLINF